MVEITQQHLNLVQRMIGNYFKIRPDNMLYADLCSIGFESLLKARNIFDPSYGTKFETLAYTVVLKDLLRFLRSNYSKEFYVSKANVFSDEVDAEEVVIYNDIDMVHTLIGEQSIEIAITYIHTLSEEYRGILFCYLNGDSYKTICTKYSISKDKYYRVIDRIIEGIRQQCLKNQSI